MKLYFDSEFTGRYKDSAFINLAIVDEYGRSFYAEFNDYLEEQVAKDVLDKNPKLLTLRDYVCDGDNTMVRGDSEKIRYRLLEWLSVYDEAIFVIDGGHYDFVLLTELLSSEGELPENICSVYLELNNEISIYKGVSVLDAFNYDRRDIFKELVETTLPENIIFNTLYNATLIKAIHQELQ